MGIGYPNSLYEVVNDVVINDFVSDNYEVIKNSSHDTVNNVENGLVDHHSNYEEINNNDDYY